MELLKDESPNDNPAVKAFLKDVLIQEQKAFDRVLHRFCLLNAITFEQALQNIETTHPFPNKPNYGAYYYKGNTLRDKTVRSHFLMSRDLLIVPGENLPVLHIEWNPDLLDETKEN